MYIYKIFYKYKTNNIKHRKKKEKKATNIIISCIICRENMKKIKINSKCIYVYKIRE